MAGQDSPGPEWHWDGQEWHWWNGSDWVPAGVGHEQMPPPPPPVEGSAGITAAPPPAGPPTGTGRSGLGAGGWAAIVLGIVLALVLIGGGLGFFLLRGDDSDVVTLQTEPLSTAINEFTPPAGTDTPVTDPPAVSGVQTLPAETVGLFGGTLDSSSCDKDQLVTYLQSNPEKAAAWARTLGITAAEIPQFVAPLTPVLLRSDTAVTNHGFENGQVTTVPAVLQAGTAVLVDEFGRPVVKCYCGNPLTPAPTLPQKVRYTGTTWPAFQPGTMTVVQQSPVVIETFVLVDVVTNVTFNRPAGTDGSADAESTTQPGTQQPSPTPSVTASPSPTVAPPSPTAEAGREAQAIAAVQDRHRACAAQIGSEGVEEVIGQASFTASPAGPNGEYDVTVTDESGTFTYLVNLNTGVVAAISADAVEVAGVCPGVFD